jgi:hypothetical protein
MWLRFAVFAMALVSLSLPADARGRSSEARKSRALLPTVRATTDCIARGILANPAALGHARQENWLEAVKGMPEECKSIGSRLVDEHDRLYGPGTGKAFVEGPYAADLPRALKARIGPEMEREDRQVEEAEEAPAPVVTPAETQEQLPVATASSVDAEEQLPVLPASAQATAEAVRQLGVSSANETAYASAAASGVPNTRSSQPGEAARTSAVGLVPLAEEPRLDRASVPSAFWLVCVSALAASLYAAFRGLSLRPNTLAERS